jgi:hypothetical protein
MNPTPRNSFVVLVMSGLILVITYFLIELDIVDAKTGLQLFLLGQAVLLVGHGTNMFIPWLRNRSQMKITRLEALVLDQVRRAINEIVERQHMLAKFRIYFKVDSEEDFEFVIDGQKVVAYIFKGGSVSIIGPHQALLLFEREIKLRNLEDWSFQPLPESTDYATI